MLIEQTIPLYSSEAVLLFKTVTMGRKEPMGLFELCLRKIGTLLGAVKDEAVYPLCYLMTIKQKITAIEMTIESTIGEYEAYLKEKKVSMADFQFQPAGELRLSFGNPLIYQFLRLAGRFDYVIRLLSLAKHTGLLRTEQYFQQKSACWQPLRMFLTELGQFKLASLSLVKIEDYLSDTPAYQEIAEKTGEIQPEILHAALKLPFLPYMDPKKIEHYQSVLKEKAKQQRALSKTDRPISLQIATPEAIADTSVTVQDKTGP